MAEKEDVFGFEPLSEHYDFLDDVLSTLVAYIRGMNDYYDNMINDSRVDSESRKKLESLKDRNISKAVTALKEQAIIKVDELGNISEDERRSSIEQINGIIDFFKNELHDEKFASELNGRLSSLNGVNKSENFDVNFEFMTNMELYQFLYDLEDKINDTFRRNNGKVNDELRDLLDVGVKLQNEIDRRLNEINVQKKEDNSLEDELDNFAKEQDKVKKTKHFRDDKELISIDNEEQSKGRKR